MTTTDQTAPAEAKGMQNRVQYDPDGSLDEVVTDGGTHLEHLGGKDWFLSCVRADGSEFCVWFRGKVTLTEEREPPAAWNTRAAPDLAAILSAAPVGVLASALEARMDDVPMQTADRAESAAQGATPMDPWEETNFHAVVSAYLRALARPDTGGREDD